MIEEMKMMKKEEEKAMCAYLLILVGGSLSNAFTSSLMCEEMKKRL